MSAAPRTVSAPRVQAAGLVQWLVLLLSTVAFMGTLSWAVTQYNYILGIHGVRGQFSESALILSALGTLLEFVCIPKDRKKISSWILWLFFVFVVLPINTVFFLGDFSSEWFVAHSLFWTGVFTVVNYFQGRGVSSSPETRGLTLRGGRLWYSLLTILLSLAGIATLAAQIANQGIRLDTSLTNVYETRERYAASSSTVALYLNNWLAFVVLPLLFMRGLQKRSMLHLGLAGAMMMLLFLGTGNRIFLIILPLVLMVSWFVRRGFSLSLIPLFFSGFLLFTASLWEYAHDPVPLALTMGRSLVIPAIISFYTFDFFSQHEMMRLSHSIFSGFFSNPYPYDPANIIGRIYFRNPDEFANTGLVGDAYMNFGYYGMIVVGLLFAASLVLIDLLSRAKKTYLVTAASLMPFIFAVNVSFFTTILTGGLLLSLILLFLLPLEPQRTIEESPYETA
ncbi:hypothetical protein [Deinococcus multiflagellatus]|uniref:Oligosaccharide repeat unit polymerase n=1 Tax=Deinococcus multiflagellatus TaxID=1656887 RepID=A0ABW1ZME4_9DEIO|nr:hypothetical protein [Deinococcus multiflagellatus]MBZ9714128.1 hypothetical protein [Deinococcus multiflagellatus]